MSVMLTSRSASSGSTRCSCLRSFLSCGLSCTPWPGLPNHAAGAHYGVYIPSRVFQSPELSLTGSFTPESSFPRASSASETLLKMHLVFPRFAASCLPEVTEITSSLPQLFVTASERPIDTLVTISRSSLSCSHISPLACSSRCTCASLMNSPHAANTDQHE
jgi:hypothetical protein